MRGRVSVLAYTHVPVSEKVSIASFLVYSMNRFMLTTFDVLIIMTRSAKNYYLEGKFIL